MSLTSATAATPAPDWWRGSVIYQVYLLSFQDGNGDGLGDLAGLLQRLPYIASLGVDALWITPFYPSPMRDHGYDVSAHCAVHPALGDMATFDALVQEAHRLGLRVLLDMVWAHTSDQHPWFASSRSSPEDPRADWYVWADARPDGTPPNNWLSVFGGPAWQWDGGRGQYYLHHFLASQPHLNLAHPHVQQACLASLRFWLSHGVDGIRIDACNYLFHDAQLRDNPVRAWPPGSRLGHPYAFQHHRHDRSQPEVMGFLRQVREVLDAHGAIALGEVGLDTDERHQLAAYTAPGRGLHLAYCLDAVAWPLSAAQIAAQVRAQLADVLAHDAGICWTLGNHDVPRVRSRWCATGGLALNRTLLALHSSLPGAYCLYQGEELGLPQAELPREAWRDPVGGALGPQQAGRDGCRTPMPWSSVGPQDAQGGFSPGPAWLPQPEAHRRLAVDLQAQDDGSLLQFYRRFLHWRRAQPVLRHGSTHLQESPPDTVFFTREHGGEHWLCLFNLGGKPFKLEMPPHLRVRAVPVPGLDAATVGPGRVVLPPYSAAFCTLVAAG